MALEKESETFLIGSSSTTKKGEQVDRGLQLMEQECYGSRRYAENNFEHTINQFEHHHFQIFP